MDTPQAIRDSFGVLREAFHCDRILRRGHTSVRVRKAAVDGLSRANLMGGERSDLYADARLHPRNKIGRNDPYRGSVTKVASLDELP